MYVEPNNVSACIEQLENFHDIASQTGELSSQGEACSRLGLVYADMGDHMKSVQNFEKVNRVHASCVRELTWVLPGI